MTAEGGRKGSHKSRKEIPILRIQRCTGVKGCILLADLAWFWQVVKVSKTGIKTKRAPAPATLTIQINLEHPILYLSVCNN